MKKIISTTLLSLFSILSFCNNPYIIDLSKQQYNGANKNWNIGEDELGFIYVANEAGLLEFDGFKWNLYELPNQSPIKSIYVEDHSNIYTGNVEDFGKWERNEAGKLVYNSLSNEISKKSLLHNEYWQTWKVNDAVYFQSFANIFRFKENKVERINIDGQALFMFPINDEIWVQQMRGALYRIRDLEWTKIPDTDLLHTTDVRIIFPLDNDRILIGTSNEGLFIYENGKLNFWNSQISNTLKNKDLNCVIKTNDGNFLFGTLGYGIYEANIEGEQINHFSINKQLSSNTVLSLFKSKFGTIWVGYDKGLGIVQYWDKLSFYGLENNNIGTIHDIAVWDNKIFVGSNQGIYFMPEKELKESKSLKDLKFIEGTQGQIWRLVVVDDKLYCGSNFGAYTIDRNLSLKKIKNIDTGVYDIEKQIIFNKEHIIASSYRNIRILNNDESVLEINLNQIPAKYTMTDHLNNLWIKEPYKGVYKIGLNKDFKVTDTISFTEQTPYLRGNINMLKVGDRIVLSNDSMFFTYDELSNKIEANDKLNDCLKNIHNIKNIVPVKEGYFWIITSDAVYYLFYNGMRANLIDYYFLNNNLSLIERYENISVINDSISYILLDNGILRYNSTGEINRDFPTKLFTKINCLDSDENMIHFNLLDNNSKISVPASYNQVKANIYSPNIFYNDENIQYRLNPIDKNWKNLKHNEIIIDRLPTGKYMLEMRVVDKMGKTSDEKRIEIIIEKPFSKTYKAYLIYFAINCLIIWLIWWLFLKRQKSIIVQRKRITDKNLLKKENQELKDEVKNINAELFTRSNIIIQKNKALDCMREVMENFINQKDKKDINVLMKKIMELLNSSKDSENHWEMMIISFEQKHPSFFKNIKKTSPDLTPTELKVCMCLRLNMDSKEIAELLNLSVRTVDNNRSRIRKKLNIPNNIDLIGFLLQY